MSRLIGTRDKRRTSPCDQQWSRRGVIWVINGTNTVLADLAALPETPRAGAFSAQSL